jgi:hypothetical protein
MKYLEAIALRNELDAEGTYTLVYVDRCSQHGSFGHETIAVKTEPHFDAKAGQIVQKIVDETHYINYDRTGALVI